MTTSHIESWNALDRHHRDKAIDKFIADNRPKEIREYYDEAVRHTVRVFSAGYGCKVTI